MSKFTPYKAGQLIKTPYILNTIIGILALSCAAPTFAAAPALDNWTVTDGNVTAPCPAGAISCEFTTEDNGFLMRKVIMPTTGVSDNYWQFIMTDPNATGTSGYDAFAPTGLNFSNESIIRADNAGDSTSVSREQWQKTLVAETTYDPTTDIEDRWSQAAYIRTGLGWGVTFETELTQIDWSAGPTSPEVLFDMSHKATGRLGNFSGVDDFNQVLTQDIWDGTDLTQKFQYQVDKSPAQHVAGTGTPFLAGGSNGGDISTGRIGSKTHPLKATYVGQIVANDTASPSLFSYTGFRNRLSHQTSSVANITELSSFETANPLVNNFNRAFRFTGTTGTYPDNPIWTIDPYNIDPDINAPVPIVTPTAWAAGTPVDVAVAALNNNVASPLSGGQGTGGPPIDLGGWTANNGVITVTPCPATVVCGPVMEGPGFLQREIYVIADGSTYYQIIVTESGATGNTAIAPTLSSAALNGEQLSFLPHIPDTYVSSFEPPPPSNPWAPGVLTFANETFVKRGGGGLSNSTQVAGIYRTPGSRAWRTGNQFNGIYVTGYTYTPAEAMAQQTKINTGWAQGEGAAPILEIKQVLGIDDSTTANNVVNGLADNMFLGWRAGSQFDYTMAANSATDYTVVSVPTQSKASGLYMRKIDGGVQTTSHALSDPLLITDGTNGGNIAWDAGDTIQALWWGDSFNFYTGTAKSGFTAYTNLTTGERTSRAQAQANPKRAFSKNQSGPVSSNPPDSWIDPFATPAPPILTNNTVYWSGQPAW